MLNFLKSRAVLAATVLIVLQGALIYSAVRPESIPSATPLSQLPKTQPGHTLEEPERLILEAYTLLKLSDKDSLAEADSDTARYENLHTFLSTMNELLLAIPGAVSKIYFKHAETQKQLFSAEIII